MVSTELVNGLLQSGGKASAGTGITTWWRHQTETFSALLAICAGNSPVTGEFPTHRPVTRSFEVSFHLRLNKPLSKQWWGWWFETLSRSLWRHCNEFGTVLDVLQRHACSTVRYIYKNPTFEGNVCYFIGKVYDESMKLSSQHSNLS